MLSNMASPALYMQAAFRSQNPCLFDLGGGNYARKENAYVFDFDPARTLTIFEQFANDLYGETARGGGDIETRERHIRQLLNFFPVYGEDDEGQMVELDAEQVLSVPRRIHAREEVKRGFMSNFLFQNIASVFRAPAGVVEIIQRFDPYEQGKAQNAEKNKVEINEGTADELSINDEGEVEIPDEQVVGKAADVFGPKVYGDIAVEFSSHVDDITKTHEADDDDRAMLDNLKEAFKQSVTEPLVQAAKESYGSELKPRQQQQIERKVQADADIQLNRQVGDYQIQARRIEQSRKDELKAASSAAERTEVNQRHDEQKAEAFQALARKLEDSRKELVQSAGETVVREVETAKKEDEKQGIEDKVRAHLRGFSRTIPSFLMAYGEEGTTLANFDTVIPADVFLDVTSITVDEFRFLRGGGDYTDTETGEAKHFVGHLFDEVVFNDSVSEFIKLRERLANYFDESQTEDIFDYMPPQKTNQIFTPRNVVVEMVDLFEKENPGCFDDPSHTFADLYMKSGLYITEIIKRLYRSEGMKAAFPDDRERLDRILERQVFGIAPTKIIYEIATHFILGFHDEVGQGCDSNFELADSAELVKEGTLDAYVERVFGPSWVRRKCMADVADSLRRGRAEAARAAADAVRCDGVELCTRLVFRTSRNELRHAGIATPAMLYDELKQAIWNTDEGITLGDHLSVGFGKVDRRRQVRVFAERHADEPRNVVASEYGFSAGIAAIWLDLFAETVDVSVSQWLGLEAAERSADDAIARADEPEASEVDHEAPTLEGFLDRELTGDICDAGLVRQRFAFEFPCEQSEVLDQGINAAVTAQIVTAGWHTSMLRRRW
jgi:hypothetical protein